MVDANSSDQINQRLPTDPMPHLKQLASNFVFVGCILK